MKLPKLKLPFGKSRDGEPAEPKSNGRKKSKKSGRGGVGKGIGLPMFGTMIFLAAALLFASVPLTVTVLTTFSAAEILDERADFAARRYQAKVEAGLVAPRAALAAIADAGLPPELFGSDATARSDREASLLRLFQDAKRVRLLPLGYDDLDKEAETPLSYADIEQLRTAEQKPGVVAPLEAYLFGSPQQHVNLVRTAAAPGGGEPVGLIVVSYDIGLVQRAMRGVGEVDGFIELVQTASDRDLSLGRAGQSVNQNGAAQRSEKISGTRWQLRYWQPLDAAQRLALPGIDVYAVYGGALLLFLVILFVVFRWLAGVLRQDQAAIINLVSDLVEKGGRGSYPVRLTSFQAMVKLISALSPRLVAAQKSAETSAATAEATPFDLFDADILPDADAPPAAPSAPVMEAAQVPASIFRAYDIRGVVGRTLTPAVAREIGRAIGSEAFERGQQEVIVARDGRLSGPQMLEALVAGLRASGRDVIDVGRVPTPVLYFATHHLGATSGVMITGSHNPPDYNGFKVVLAGEALSDQALQGLYQRIKTDDLLTGDGGLRSENVVTDYIDRIASDIRLGQPLKVVVDCGNGAAGEIAPELFRAIGCDVTELYCDIDGRFPNHHPDPSQVENLRDLILAVRNEGADVGLAFDGDGDRIGIVDSAGNVIWPDRLMMLFARDLLTRHRDAEILFDVKCTRNLAEVIRENGGRPTMWKTGHSLIKAKMRESGALLAGEMSGHFFFSERWFGFDDGLYAGARLLEILSNLEMATAEVFAGLPDSVCTPELKITVPDGAQHALIDLLVTQAQFPDAKLITIDGLRVEFPDGWGLVRASNTTPNLVLRFEADDDNALRTIQEQFRKLLMAVEPNLELPF